MHQSKVIELMRFFSTKDYRVFGDFVHSPYFNKSEEVSQLYEIIKKHGPKFVSRKLEKEQIWKALFPKKKYDEKKLGYLQTDLVRLIERYIVQIRLEEEDILRYSHQLKTYQKVSANTLFQQALKKTKSYLSNAQYHDSNYYFENYIISEICNDFFEKQERRKFDTNLQTAADHLDLYYLSKKMKYTCEMINRQNIMSGEYELKMVDQIIDYLANDELEIPAIDIYYSIFQLLTNSDNEVEYHHLKDMLQKYESHFPIEELRDMYAYARNYCIRKANQGNEQFLHELLELYKRTLANKVIYGLEYLSHFSYINIVKAAVRLKEYDWTKEFIEKYKTELEPDFQESAYAFGIATLYFEQKDYREALFQLHQIEFTDVYYALGSKLMLLKIYYELEDIDPLLSLIESFRVYIKRNKLVDNASKIRYNNLLTFISKTIKIPKGENEKLQKLLGKVKETKKVVSIKWLIGIIKGKMT